MKKLFSLRYLTLWCFVLLLALFFPPCLRQFCRAARDTLGAEGGGLAALEERFDEYFPLQTRFVTLNGGLSRLLGQRAVNERYRLDNGQLTYVIPELDVNEIARQTVEFAQALREEGIPFLFVNTPFKIDPEDKQLPVGVEDYSNENADRFLSVLRDNGVPTLDLRERERAEGLDHYSLFYPTDHHWTAETGFWAFREIVSRLAAEDASFTVDGLVLDGGEYEKTVLRDVYLGSHGRRVGPWYAGMDDLSLIEPRFDTSLRFLAADTGEVHEGDFSEALLFPEMLEGDPFLRSRYDVYLGGEYARMLLTNGSAAQGLEVQSTPKKLLIFKDSFSLVLAPFMALGYEETEWLDLRLTPSGGLDAVLAAEPDAVLVVYNPGAYEDNNWEMFDFLG